MPFERMRQAFPVAAVAAVGLTLLIVWVSAASLFLILSKSSGSPGTVVSGRTGGDGAFAPGEGGAVATFFAPRARADSVKTPDNPNLVPVGYVQVDAAGNGTIHFKVPAVPVGRYVVMVDCPACAASSAGQEMLPVGEFEVTATPPNTAAVREDRQFRLAAIVGTLLLAGAVAAQAASRRRHSIAEASQRRGEP